MIVRQASLRPLAVGCQPSVASIGAREIPPPESTVVCDLVPVRRSTRTFCGASSLSASAALLTAALASRFCASEATVARLTGWPPAKTTLPSASTLTVI